MTERQETVMAIIMVVGIYIFILLSTCSCSTTRDVVETVTVHDTILRHRVDTVNAVRIVHHNDTIRWRETHTYTVNQAGDTVREFHHFHDTERITTIDSTYRYQSERDSLRQALREEKSKEKVTIKEKRVMAWWAWIIVGCSIAISTLLLVNSLIIQPSQKGRK